MAKEQEGLTLPAIELLLELLQLEHKSQTIALYEIKSQRERPFEYRTALTEDGTILENPVISDLYGMAIARQGQLQELIKFFQREKEKAITLLPPFKPGG